MGKKKWWQRVLFFIRFAAKEVEDGNIGAGKKTAQGGKIAGGMIDAALEAADEKM